MADVMRDRKRVALWAVLAGVAAMGGLWLALRSGSGRGAAGAETLTFPAREGSLVISVKESGTIKPRETTVIKSQVEGRSTILYLIQEGREVKKGELLVELDVTALTDTRVDQEIRVRNAEASFIRARENLEVVKNQACADVEKAELTLRFAQEDVKNYQDGEYPTNRKDLQGRITLAEEDVQRTAEKLKWSQQLFDEKYLSGTELQGDSLSAKKAALDLDLAQSRLQLLEKFTYKRQIDKLTSDVTQAEMALVRTRLRTSADVVQAEADLSAREAEFARQKEKLQKIGEQIAKAKITAPTDGVVIYATSTQFSFRGNVEPLAEGQQVVERQELIHLPLADTFMAAVKIHESNLKKIYVGLPVQITVDAIPGLTFTGTVGRIAPLPDAQSAFMNADLKVYNTDIHIEDGGDVLRTGMTCTVEIVVERHDQALCVPVQCVVRLGGQPTVYLLEKGQPMPRPVQIGLDNNRMVHILSGLATGEAVMLTPPLADARAADGAPFGDMAIPPRPIAEKAKPANGSSEGVAPPPRLEGGREGRRRPPTGGQDAAPQGTPAADTPRAGATGATAPDGTGGTLPPSEAGGLAPGGGPPGGAMTPEARERMRERLEKMSPEEREAARRQWMERRRQQERPQDGGGAAAGGTGQP